MKTKDYMNLQIEMYLTDKEDELTLSGDTALRPFDFFVIRQFKEGHILLQPLDDHGKPKGKPFWEDYRKINLECALYRSDFVALFPECA